MRELTMIAKGVASTDHPVLAHIIPIRRCNLACKYCNEYDDFSKPVPLDVMKSRIDHLARLGTTIVTLSGGEPMLHPELDEIIAHMRTYPIIAGMITNGYLLTADRIKRLNRAGLDHLQISIDNVMPDDVSKKSLKVLGQEAAVAGGTCRLPREHQFGGGRRHAQSARCAGRGAAGGTVGAHVDYRNYSRWRGSASSSGRRRARSFSEDEEPGEDKLLASELVPEQHCARPAKSLAMPGGRALRLHLRRRAGALLLATARISRHSSGAVHGERYSAGVSDGKKLRATLHGVVRAPSFLFRFLARAAIEAGAAIARGSRPTGSNRVERFRRR